MDPIKGTDKTKRIQGSGTSSNESSLTGSLVQVLQAYMSKPVLTMKDKQEIYDLLTEKLKKFDTELEDIGDLFGQLYVLTNIEYAYKDDVLEIVGDSEAWRSLFKSTHDERLLFKSDLPVLLAKTSYTEDQKAALLGMWKKQVISLQTPNKIHLIELEKNCRELFRKKCQELIDKTPISKDIRFDTLSRMSQVVKEREDELDDFRYFPYSRGHWQEYQKTLSFLIGDKDPVRAAIRTFLYINSTIEYEYNKKDLPPLWSIRDKKGDCSEALMLYSEVIQHTPHTHLKVMYIKEKGEKVGHAFSVFRYKGLIFFADQRGVSSYADLKSGLKQRFKLDPAKTIIHLQTVEDLLNLPPNERPLLRWLQPDKVNY